MADAAAGMRGIEAADTAITWIDGEKGELRYRGYPIGELAENFGFEDAAFLLWYGELPEPAQSEELRQDLRRRRVARGDLIRLVADAPERAHPLDVLRYAVSFDALGNPRTGDNSREANDAKSRDFTAWFPVVMAAFHRRCQGEEPVAPDPELDTAANLLYMLRGKQAPAVAVRTLDTSLLLHADHEFNASTFAARVTIATQSNLHAAIAAALGTLAGPRHGGASDQVIHMVQEIGSVDAAPDWTEGELAAHRRIMGFGHAVYRTVDPRSRNLRRMALELTAGTDHADWIAILDAVGEVMAREKHLYPNVDLYAAIVNHELGIEPRFYSSLFACSRIVGWTAHAIEQLEQRMIRPTGHYIGPPPRSLPVHA